LQFSGVEHRLEVVRRVDAVEYVNDSIATSPERAVAALRSFTRPIVLIAGGRSKHLALDRLADEIVKHCRAVVAIGEMADEVVDAVRGRSGGSDVVIRHGQSLSEAVLLAHGLARSGDVVLLSPAGTSFDQFRDFEERGRRFKAAVAELSAGS
ncbi:MAG TPA: cyanophycin synthetase, partial [Chloroflexota bacterium]|nr:cyanophycin synthetase [Chloroflexota bacterium]